MIKPVFNFKHFIVNVVFSTKIGDVIEFILEELIFIKMTSIYHNNYIVEICGYLWRVLKNTVIITKEIKMTVISVAEYCGFVFNGVLLLWINQPHKPRR